MPTDTPGTVSRVPGLIIREAEKQLEQRMLEFVSVYAAIYSLGGNERLQIQAAIMTAANRVYVRATEAMDKIREQRVNFALDGFRQRQLMVEAGTPRPELDPSVALSLQIAWHDLPEPVQLEVRRIFRVDETSTTVQVEPK